MQMPFPMKKNKQKGLFLYLILVLWGITTVFPFLWIVINSLKPSREVMNSSFSLPVDFTWDNYRNVFTKLDVLEAYRNSIIISGTVTIGVLLLASMMAFAFTRYRFRGRELLLSLIMASLMFPVFSTIIPVFRLMSALDQINRPLSVILPQIAGNLSFAIVVLMGFMKDLPSELEEAAYIEGAGIWKVFSQIVIPLSKPSLAAVAIFSFLWSYNDLFTQLIMIRRRIKFPVCALLNEVSSKYGTDYGLMAASVVVIIMPVLIIYLFLQKNIMKGLTAGAIKG